MESWTVEFWENDNGVCYIEKDILNIIKIDKLLEERLFKKIHYYTQKSISSLMKADILEDVGDGIWELKFHLKLEIRYLGCFLKEENIIKYYVLTGFVKKDQKIRNKYIKKARNRLEELKHIKK
jgi:phage-related protein